MFFALARSGHLKARSYLSDVNPNLIDAYTGVRDDVDCVVDLLQVHKRRHGETYFYKMRKRVPTTLSERAARIIYLNKTCFNGLYRENKKGEFNAPLGSYRNPNICDEANLRAVAQKLQGVNIGARDFSTAAKLPKRGDIVYFDPPYDPISKTADFTGYAKGGFGVESQEKLAETFTALVHKGVHVILSNSLTPLTRELYSGFNFYKVSANRVVNSRADRRGKVSEALITSFPIWEERRGSRGPVNGRGLVSIKKLERIRTKQWLIENNYADVAGLIDEVTSKWLAEGKRTRRNWWEILAGDLKGNSRVIAGRQFPVLRAAQIRKGVPVTENAICRNLEEEAPAVVRVTGRWPKEARVSSR